MKAVDSELLFYSVNKSLLNTYYVLRTRQEIGDMVANEKNRILS